tara:strand:+ start:1251 stop:1739 length:489 start_codon:yes stop_codon:yes gene_type:complete
MVSSDLAAFTKLHGNPKVMDIIPAPVLSSEQCMKNLHGIMDNYRSQKSNVLVWGVETKADKSWIGTCALVFEKDNRIEIGYRFDPEYWGRGFGSEIANALIDFAFQTTKAHEVFADVNSVNSNSVKILEKVLSFKGKTENSELGVTDLNFALTRDTWLQNQD